MKRILLDQGLSAKAAEILRQAGWDAVHVREIGMRDAPDVDILALAASDSRVVVTLDRDYNYSR
jgi:predicted nuclease of predicted toxin-antitoxin system